jgi:outer membrane protein assembly factor BamB
VVGDTIYVASNNLYALRIRDGSVIWSYPAEATSVVAVADGTVYFATSGEVFALHS